MASSTCLYDVQDGTESADTLEIALILNSQSHEILLLLTAGTSFEEQLVVSEEFKCYYDIKRVCTFCHVVLYVHLGGEWSMSEENLRTNFMFLYVCDWSFRKSPIYVPQLLFYKVHSIL